MRSNNVPKYNMTEEELRILKKALNHVKKLDIFGNFKKEKIVKENKKVA